MLPMPAVMNCTYKGHHVSPLNTMKTQMGGKGIAPLTLDKRQVVNSYLTSLHP
jgi:hypothetical protein